MRSGFSTDIGSRFIYKDHKFWMYYTYNSSRQFYFVNMSQELDEEYIEEDITIEEIVDRADTLKPKVVPVAQHKEAV